MNNKITRNMLILTITLLGSGATFANMMNIANGTGTTSNTLTVSCTPQQFSSGPMVLTGDMAQTGTPKQYFGSNMTAGKNTCSVVVAGMNASYQQKSVNLGNFTIVFTKTASDYNASFANLTVRALSSKDGLVYNSKPLTGTVSFANNSGVPGVFFIDSSYPYKN